MKLLHWVLLAGVAGFVYTVKDIGEPSENVDPSAPQVLTSYFASGHVRTEVTYAAGRKEGPARQFRPDGTLESEGRFHDSRMEGPWTFFREDGSVDLARSGIYVAGELERPEVARTQSLEELPSASARE